jgi:hypothetical protein
VEYAFVHPNVRLPGEDALSTAAAEPCAARLEEAKDGTHLLGNLCASNSRRGAAVRAHQFLPSHVSSPEVLYAPTTSSSGREGYSCRVGGSS